MIVEQFRRSLVGEVRAVFNDRARGEQPVARSTEAWLAPDSVAWRVHGDVTTMMVGGIAALLLQMLHPEAVAGVWDHSNFRSDMLGRLRRTARFMAATTYAYRDEAQAAVDRVRRIHAKVGGVLEDGTPYRADDPRTLAWVHVAGSICFLDAWMRFGEPGMSRADQDQYFADVAGMARALGTAPVPETRAEAEALLESFRPVLVAGTRAREVARIIMSSRATSLRTSSVQSLMMQAAIDLLPPWARKMHELRASVVARPAVNVITFGLANTLRWAFAAEARS